MLSWLLVIRITVLALALAVPLYGGFVGPAIPLSAPVLAGAGLRDRGAIRHARWSRSGVRRLLGCAGPGIRGRDAQRLAHRRRGLPVGPSTRHQIHPALAGSVIAWLETDAPHEFDAPVEVWASMLDVSGKPVGTPFRIGESTWDARLAVVSPGGPVQFILWPSADHGLMATRIGSRSAPSAFRSALRTSSATTRSTTPSGPARSTCSRSTATCRAVRSPSPASAATSPPSRRTARSRVSIPSAASCSSTTCSSRSRRTAATDRS